MENGSNSVITDLTESLEALGAAMEKMQLSLKACREAGMNQLDIRDAILEQLPEENRAAFMQQWPMLSMMMMAL